MISRRSFSLLTGAALGTIAAPAILRAQSRPVLKIDLGPQQLTQADTKQV
jgi:hypothetical protein